MAGGQVDQARSECCAKGRESGVAGRGAADPNERLRLGLDAATTAVNALRAPVVTAALIHPVLTVIKVRYGFKTLQPVEIDDVWWVEGEASPKKSQKTAREASPIKELLKEAPENKTLKLAVRIHLRGHLDKETVTETHGLNITFAQTTDPLTGQKTPRPTMVGAAVVRPPVPGSNVVEVVTWNTGLVSSPNDDIATHAERQLESVFAPKIMKPDFIRRIEAIELYLSPFSPCDSCSHIVDKIGALLPDSCPKDKRLLEYKKAYPGRQGGLNGTTDATLERLRNHWTVKGPPPVTGEFAFK